MSTKNNIEMNESKVETLSSDEFKKEFADRFRDYALYVIKDRSVPDVRDGLKPVHRRILYAMQVGGYISSGKTYKSARVVGDVIGKYHPHGDSSVYDALVRMAQDWSCRYTLIQGQGNFGSVDGDNPAAMRYTECKLNKFGELGLGRRLKMDAVDFVDNYDGELQEPEVLPSEVPYLLLNGTTGIAVGIATDFVPHNLTEVMKFCKRMLKYRTKGEKGDKNKLVMKFISGPDFPTGGIVVSNEAEFASIYKTGNGKLTLRSKMSQEMESAGKWNIVVSEIPYGIKKEDIIIAISEMVRAKKLPIIEDIYDESDDDGMRIVIVPKSKKLNFQDVVMHLYSVTSLQITVKVNMNALVDSGERPKLLSFAESIDGWLDFHIDTTIRVNRFRLSKVLQRLHVLEGFMVAYLNIDRVIEIIRHEDDPELTMIKEFGLTDIQVNAIVDLKLRNLKKIGEQEIKVEQDALEAEKLHLNNMIDDDDYRSNAINTRFDEIIKQFGDPRRTDISFASVKAKTISSEILIDKEPATLIMTKYGFIKFLKAGASVEKTKLKDGDAIEYSISGHTTDYAAFITKSGQVFTKIVADLPTSRTEGKHLGEFFTVDHNDPVVDVVLVNGEKTFIAISDAGHALLIAGKNIINNQKKGKKVFSIDKKASKITLNEVSSDHNYVMVVSSDGYMAMMPLTEFPELPKGKGVQSLRLRANQKIDLIVPIYVGATGKVNYGSDSLDYSISSSDYIMDRAKLGIKIHTRTLNRMKLELI